MNLDHLGALTRRSIVNTFRQPATVAPSIVFPLIFLSMSAGALGKATDIPGFPPVDSFLQFGITATIVQGILFGAVAAGTDMAKDIEGGFFERLVASPVSRTAIVVGRIGGAATLGFVQALVFLTLGLLVGVDIEGGLVSMVMIAVAASILAAGVGSVTVSMGLRTGSSEAVQGSFPLIFVFLFFSSAFFPRQLMSGWFENVATLNPLSHLVEGLRHQVIAALSVSEWVSSVAIALGIFAFGVALALRALDRRLTATHG
ncbi:MAG: ABC transporter permease [Actinomycetota bacterium]